MKNVSSRTLFLWSVLIFVASLFIGYFMQDYKLAASGLLIMIILTAFVPGWFSTLAAGLTTMFVMTGLIIYFKPNDADLLQTLFSQIYSLFITVFTVVVVFYLKKMQANFDTEKTHMASLFENATEGILLTNQQGQIIMANPSAVRMLGYAPYELENLSVDALLPSKYQHGHHRHRDSFHNAPSNRTMGVGRDLYAKRKDGSEFPVEISLSQYVHSGDSFVIAFIVDITIRKEIERNLSHQREELEKYSNDIRKLNMDLEGKVEERTLILKEALQKLEQSQKELSELLNKEKQLNEIKSRFVSMASHEFRTPLSTILSSATLVSKYPTAEDFEKREKHINRIKDSVKHMNELLEDFLSLGKLEEGKVGVTVSEFSVQEFMDDVVDEMRAHLKEEQQIDFTYEGENLFTTDKRMLKNIVLNLMSNGIKFSPIGKTISVRASVGSDLKISVKDQGLGIPKEDQEHLFSTFFRASNVSNIQGTGLGLPIVKRYVNLLKGDISLESELEKGTTVSFQLPRLEITVKPKN